MQDISPRKIHMVKRNTKICSTSFYEGNTNNNHNQYHFISTRMAIKQKIAGVSEDMEKLESLCISDRNLK